MVAISEIKKAVTHETVLLERSIEKDELIIDDESLDHAINFSKSLNVLNDGYIRIIDSLETLNSLKIKNNQDENDVNEVLEKLKIMNRRAIGLWINFNNDDFLSVACKSALLDFRVNIRSLKEYIEDVHDKFFLRDRYTKELDDIFNSL